jgi:hypothetical protein
MFFSPFFLSFFFKKKDAPLKQCHCARPIAMRRYVREAQIMTVNRKVPTAFTGL